MRAEKLTPLTVGKIKEVLNYLNDDSVVVLSPYLVSKLNMVKDMAKEKSASDFIVIMEEDFAYDGPEGIFRCLSDKEYNVYALATSEDEEDEKELLEQGEELDWMTFDAVYFN